MELIVTRIKVDGEVVSLKCEDAQSERTYKILLDDFLAHPFRDGQSIDAEQISYLDQQHVYCYAYRRIMRFLAGADHTEREVRRKLAEIRDLKAENLEKIVSRLKESGYLNDEHVAASQLYSDQNKLLGRRKTLYNLTERGIEKNRAYQLLSQISDDDELERGVQRAKKIWQRDAQRPYRQRLARLRQQLIVDGYEDADAIIARLDLENDEQVEEENLRRDLDRAVRKYAGKYQPNKLRSQVIKYLLAKGYSYEMIQKCYGNEGEEYEDQ